MYCPDDVYPKLKIHISDLLRIVDVKLRCMVLPYLVITRRFGCTGCLLLSHHNVRTKEILRNLNKFR